MLGPLQPFAIACRTGCYRLLTEYEQGRTTHIQYFLVFDSMLGR
jgi:hypothetical protein